MPTAPLRPCGAPGCGRATAKRYCQAHAAAAERYRTLEAPWRLWYRTLRWANLRALVLYRDGYRCQCETCQGRYLLPRATVVDHRVPHRGDAALFWDETNLQAMSKRCHDRKTGQELHGEGRGR